MHTKYEKMHSELQKERERHTYYKKLMRDLGDLEEVKKVLEMSVSD